MESTGSDLTPGRKYGGGHSKRRREFSDRERAQAGGFRVNPTTLAAWDASLEAARALRATAILFQCPASFKATDQNVDSMREFFATVERPDRVRLLWEPRGPWSDDLVLTLCRDLGLVHAVDPAIDAYVLFNNIPRVADVRRFVELEEQRRAVA